MVYVLRQSTFTSIYKNAYFSAANPKEKERGKILLKVPILNTMEGAKSGEHQLMLNLLMSVRENVHLNACNPTPTEVTRKGIRMKNIISTSQS